MADEMCNFYMMYWFDPKQNDLGGNPEESCGSVDESQLKFPADSDVPLPGSGHKMEMKRDFVEGKKPEVCFTVLLVEYFFTLFFRFFCISCCHFHLRLFVLLIWQTPNLAS